MSDSSDLPSRSAMIDAFIQPPTVVEVGDRELLSNGDVAIVSHVELWPWRVVVRGVLATEETIDHARYGAPFTHAGDDDETWAARKHEWLSRWSLTDDLGTVYEGDSGGMGGTQLWWDYTLSYRSPVPDTASILTLGFARRQADRSSRSVELERTAWMR